MKNQPRISLGTILLYCCAYCSLSTFLAGFFEFEDCSGLKLWLHFCLRCCWAVTSFLILTQISILVCCKRTQLLKSKSEELRTVCMYFSQLGIEKIVLLGWSCIKNNIHTHGKILVPELFPIPELKSPFELSKPDWAARGNAKSSIMLFLWTYLSIKLYGWCQPKNTKPPYR